MKTVRTRVKSAFKRNSKGTPTAPADPVKLPAASTSAPSLLLPEKTKGAEPPRVTSVSFEEKAQHFPDIRLETEPFSEVPTAMEEKRDDLDLSGLKFTGDEPEHIYAESPLQPITITDDSRRSTPKRRATSVPRLSSDNHFPSPSIASRILTTLPPTEDIPIDDLKFVSPVDPNYLIDEFPDPGPSLLAQPMPTDSSFVEVTPKDDPPPLPPLHELLAQHVNSKRMDSGIEPTPRTVSVHTIEEDRPLLDPSILTAEVDEILDSVWPLPPRTFPSLGWTEHVLPSSSYYYSHAATRTVTDLDLRDEKKLAAVTSYLKSKRSPEPSTRDINDDRTPRRTKVASILRVEEGVDLWLRDANPGLPSKKDEWEFMPMRNWVLHATRAVTFDPPSERDTGQAPEDLSDEDRLDLENRYWHYMSTHPAHVSLPQTAYDEALEVLTWCYTDGVMKTPQPRPIPPPFTQKECATLLDLFRTVTASSASPSSHVIRTRLIAQILLRYTEWRQKYVTKSSLQMPTDILSGLPKKTEHAMPFRRTVLRFISILCLGIPSLFETTSTDRYLSHYQHTDEEEQGKMTSITTGDVLLYGSQPLVAALLLSASVTLLALPELNGTSRVSALISALCAASSMVSFVVTLYGRHPRWRLRKNAVGAFNAILASLPFVMLAYSLCAFVVGVIAYAVSGGLTTRSGGFGKYTAWVVIGVWIALVAVLTISAAVTKRGL